MPEIDLLKDYPRAKRNLEERLEQKTEEVRLIARQFGKEFFDGERKFGYGGFSYNPKFWRPVVPAFEKYFGLSGRSSILDIGCAKGFMLHDFSQMIPGIKVRGIDISKYAIENALADMKPFLSVGDAKSLPFADHSFDLVISINTIHNLPCHECLLAIREIQRVSRQHAFITVDAYRTLEEKKRMDAWNLTAQTYMNVDDWKDLFKQAGYTGDYFWFIP